MKISLLQDNFKEALQRVVYITDKNTTLPILKNILLRVKGNVITLISTNLELSIQESVRGKVEEEGEVTIPGRLLYEYIQLLPKEKVDLESEGQKIHVSCKNFQTTILGMGAEDFPLLPEPPKGEEIVVSAKTLREAIASVLFAAAPDETRPEISGVLCQVQKGKMFVVATDSYRLAERQIPLVKSEKDMRVIFPARSMSELQRIVSDEDGDITLVIGENQALVKTEDYTFTTRLIDGQYPDYQQVIPPNHKTRAVLPVAEFTKAVKAASLFAPSGVNDIHLSFHPDRREVEVAASSGQVGENKIVVAGDVSGDANSIVFNWRYLMEGVDRIKTNQVVADLVNATSPGVLRPKDETNYTYLIMPIKQ